MYSLTFALMSLFSFHLFVRFNFTMQKQSRHLQTNLHGQSVLAFFFFLSCCSQFLRPYKVADLSLSLLSSIKIAKTPCSPRAFYWNQVCQRQVLYSQITCRSSYDVVLSRRRMSYGVTNGNGCIAIRKLKIGV